MAIYGIGCDIINVHRIERVFCRFGDKFVNRILTSREREYAALKTNCHGALMLFLAKRYAAKEAYVKATGAGVGKMVGFQDIEIANDVMGKPYFNKVVACAKGGSAFLSLSDELPYVIAYVIIECGDECDTGS